MDESKGDLMMKGVAGRMTQWVRPHVPEASDGILTSAGICEGFAGAGVGTKVLIFAGFAGLVAGTLAAGAVLPWLAIILIPGPPRAAVTFVIVLLALALTGWISAQISNVHPERPIVRTAAIGILSMTITYAAGHLFHP